MVIYRHAGRLQAPQLHQFNINERYSNQITAATKGVFAVDFVTSDKVTADAELPPRTGYFYPDGAGRF